MHETYLMHHKDTKSLSSGKLKFYEFSSVAFSFREYITSPWTRRIWKLCSPTRKNWEHFSHSVHVDTISVFNLQISLSKLRTFCETYTFNMFSAKYKTFYIQQLPVETTTVGLQRLYTMHFIADLNKSSRHVKKTQNCT